MENRLFKSKIDIEFKKISGGTSFIHSCGENNLNVMVMNGARESIATVEVNKKAAVPPFSLFLVGKNTNLTIDIPEGGSAIVLLFDYVGKYCDSKICSFLEENAPCYTNSYSSLLMNDGLKGYFITMDTCLSGLFDEIPFREIKYKEFFFILCQWLEISDFTEFLHPAMGWYDPVFRRKVLDNYAKSYRVKTLAADIGYSENDFVIKFKKEFGTIPSSWIKEQINRTIKDRLSRTFTPIKDIAQELQMSSVQSFTRYCKRNFGKTPNEIRKSAKGF